MKFPQTETRKTTAKKYAAEPLSVDDIGTAKSLPGTAAKKPATEICSNDRSSAKTAIKKGKTKN